VNPSRGYHDSDILKEAGGATRMANIRPVSDLRNRTHEIEDLCHRTGEPVFISKNGRDNLVVMSHQRYEQMEALVDLYRKLDDAEADESAGDTGIPHASLIEALRSRLA
jgi:prevent-host-death family protein